MRWTRSLLSKAGLGTCAARAQPQPTQSEEENIVTGLTSGADDYVTKPFK